jgi:hypothetical protein
MWKVKRHTSLETDRQSSLYLILRRVSDLGDASIVEAQKFDANTDLSDVVHIMLQEFPQLFNSPDTSAELQSVSD